MNVFEMGANMTHSMYRGWYRRESEHEPDQDLVLERAKAHGIKKMIFTANTLGDSNFAYKITANVPNYFLTIGVNPMHANDVFKIASGEEDFSRD